MNHGESGYVALASMLVIAAITLIIGVSLALITVNELQSSLATKKGSESLLLVESCVEDVLLTLNEAGSIPSTIELPEITCSVTINQQGSGSYTFTVLGEYSGYNNTVVVTATRGSSVVITSWQQQ